MNKKAFNELRHLLCRTFFDVNLMDNVSYLDIFSGNVPEPIREKLAKSTSEINAYTKIKYNLTDDDVHELTRQVLEDALMGFVFEHAFTEEPPELSPENKAKIQEDIKRIMAEPIKPNPSLQ